MARSTVVLSCRLTRAERAVIQLVADAEGISAAALLRRVAVATARRRLAELAAEPEKAA